MQLQNNNTLNDTIKNLNKQINTSLINVLNNLNARNRPVVEKIHLRLVHFKL